MAQHTKLTIEAQPWQVMVKSAIGTYPEECCGFIFGNASNTQSAVVYAVGVTNTSGFNKCFHFGISVKSYLEAERYADENQLLLLGVYHSHPDHTASPSALDLKPALPNFSYLIISVKQEQINEVRCWQLDENYLFQEQSIEINSPV